MIYHEQSEDYRPLFWVQGRPVYATTFVLSVHIIAFVIAAICVGIFGPSLLMSLELAPWEIWHSGQVWRLVTYASFDPGVFQGSFWFILNLFFFYFFGREVEQLIGRKNFLVFYAALILLPALLFCVAGPFLGFGAYFSCNDVFFGVLVAFATIYPGVMPLAFLPISVRTFTLLLLGVYTLIDFSNHYYGRMFMLWTCTGVAYGAMRLVGAGRDFAWLRDWFEERRTKKLAQERNFKIVQEKKTTESIDAILEKISKQGVNSLNAQERAALESARTKLLKRDER